MKKSILAISCCTLISFAAKAQNQNLDFKYALRFSNTTTVENFEEYYGGPYQIKSRTTSWVAPSVGLIIKNKRNNFHEIELTGLGIKSNSLLDNISSLNPADPYTSYGTISHITFQYQYSQNFLKNKNSKWMPSLGFGLSSDLSLNEGGYSNSTENYHSSYKSLTFIGFVAPAVSYSFSKRFFATASIPVSLFYSNSSFGKASSNVDPQQYQNFEDNYFTTFPNRFSFKIGLGIKL